MKKYLQECLQYLQSYWLHLLDEQFLAFVNKPFSDKDTEFTIEDV